MEECGSHLQNAPTKVGYDEYRVPKEDLRPENFRQTIWTLYSRICIEEDCGGDLCLAVGLYRLKNIHI